MKDRKCEYVMPLGVCRLEQTTFHAWDYGDILAVQLSEPGAKWPEYSITHRYTGFAVATGIPSRKAARMCASVVAALPMAWESKTQEPITAAWQAAPQWVKDLLLEIHSR